MGSTNLERRIADRQRDARRALGAELRKARLDANLSIRSVSAAAGLHHSHLPRIEIGKRSPSQDALVALATVMGRDVSIRLFESATPQVRDRIQVRMIEALLAALDPRWTPRLEVAVHRPVRGVIDVVLQDAITAGLVAGEAHSVLHTVEGQLRWAGDKAEALPSALGWPWVDTVEPPTIGRLLLLRSCVGDARARELAAGDVRCGLSGRHRGGGRGVDGVDDHVARCRHRVGCDRREEHPPAPGRAAPGCGPQGRRSPRRVG